jgi:hypothetical protein
MDFCFSYRLNAPRLVADYALAVSALRIGGVLIGVVVWVLRVVAFGNHYGTQGAGPLVLLYDSHSGLFRCQLFPLPLGQMDSPSVESLLAAPQLKMSGARETANFPGGLA